MKDPGHGFGIDLNLRHASTHTLQTATHCQTLSLQGVYRVYQTYVTQHIYRSHISPAQLRGDRLADIYIADALTEQQQLTR